MKRNKLLMLGLLLMQSNVWAQTGLIGYVIDDKGKPIVNAKVNLVNSSVDTFTDIDGKFTISASEGAEIKITTPTNATKIIKVGNESTLKIMMDFSTNEVSLNPILNSQPLSESVISVSQASYSELSKSSSLTLRNSLFGQVLGLSALQGSGAIWDEKSPLSIRGLQSLNGSGILILVDGFERPIDDLSIEEVESISVLKDAAAVALYGYKGINGVLLVKTKRGISNERKIDISYDHGFLKPNELPKLADAYMYANAINEAYANDGKGQRYTQFELEAFKNGNLPYQYPNVNWMDEVIGDWGYSNNYNVSFQGGNKKMRYYTALNLVNNNGFFKNTEMNDGYSNQNEYSKANIRANLDISLSKSTMLQVNLWGSLSEYNHTSYTNTINNLFLVPAAAFPIKTEDGIWGGNSIWGNRNPVASLQALGYHRSHSRTLFADATLSQKLDFITEGLKISLKVGYDNTTTYWDLRNKTYQYAFDMPVLNENGVFEGETNRWIGGQDTELTFSKNMNGPMFYRFNFMANLDYEKKFRESRLYTALIWNVNHDVQSGRHNTLNNINISSYTHYILKNKYIADLSLVTSASNRLPVNHKFAFSPTLALGWIVSEEDFMNNSSIDFLKLRASAGILHNDYVPEWNITTDAFGGGGSYYFGAEHNVYGGIAESRMPTQNFKHERAIKYNVGVDMKLLGSLNVMADAYYQVRDQIMVGTGGKYSSVLGLTPSYEALGRVDSKGFELGLDYIEKIGDVEFNVGAKYSIAKNEIIEKMEGPLAEEYLKTTGHPIGQPFGLEAIGFFKDEKDIAESPKQLFSDVRPGDVKYKDQNNDGFINENDYVAMGYNMSVPEMYYSFNGGLEYKGFGFDFMFQGIANRSTWLNATSVYRPLAGNSTISEHYYNNRWTKDNLDAKYPRLSSEANPNNNQSSSLWLADASYLKLRHCEIYYKLPKSILSKFRMNSATVYLRGMDLLSFDNMELFDPEVSGISYPTDKSIHIGLKVGF